MVGERRPLSRNEFVYWVAWNRVEPYGHQHYIAAQHLASKSKKVKSPSMLYPPDSRRKAMTLDVARVKAENAKRLVAAFLKKLDAED